MQFQSGHAAELNVEHQTVWSREWRRNEEGLGRGESMDLKSRGAEQPAERPGKAVIIVHDRDISFVFDHRVEPVWEIRGDNSAGGRKLPIVLWCSTGRWGGDQ